MSKRDWKLFLFDILEAIRRIEKYIEDMNYEAFLRDTKTQDAVVRNLEIIGEAARKVPESIKERYSKVPWSQVIGLRNRLIHGYFVIDYDIVWYIISNELKELKQEVEEMLKGEEE
jgi:uncharacterized protein with HEPN domain